MRELLIEKWERCTITSAGTMIWYNKYGAIHRDNDKPAIIWKNGDMHWCKNGEIHREKGKPAVVYPMNKNKQIWIHDKFVKHINY